MEQPLVGRAEEAAPAGGLLAKGVEGAIHDGVDQGEQRVEGGSIRDVLKLVAGEHEDAEGRDAIAKVLAQLDERGHLVEGFSSDHGEAFEGMPPLRARDLLRELIRGDLRAALGLKHRRVAAARAANGAARDPQREAPKGPLHFGTRDSVCDAKLHEALSSQAWRVGAIDAT